MFKKILIANRGEISRRIMAACREMEIGTVAVYSEADRKAIHVLEADEAVFLGESDPRESYLNIDKIIKAAHDTGAEAIHPGYGFLAENPDLAAKCQEEGLTFIGPSAEVIRRLGDKLTARKIMLESGVPIIPGMIQAESDPELIAEEAQKIGYPVLIKASAGGGGKGIRLVNSPEKIKEACLSASGEARTAFGDDSVYVEKFFPKVRHIEFQIMADKHGKTIHMLERECSIQRRRQKIIEEAPSNILSPALREKMGEAAVTAAKASGYVNAGTVEFILDPDQNFYFLEVNTRLQVEHPVTEMITGLDLARLQIEIAAGEPLSLSQEDIKITGHSIECRIYAEDPENDFAPCPGKIIYLKEPEGPGIRNDGGVYSGVEVPVHYDPILSKLIVHGKDRKAAVQRMIKALREYVILGVKTPVPFLLDIFQSEAFQKGNIFTDFIETYFPEWRPEQKDIDLACLAYIADEITAAGKPSGIAVGEEKEVSPFQTLGPWRL